VDYSTAKTRYSPLTPVYYVRAAELRLRRQQVTIAISSVPNCVVLLDDAHLWYDDSDFLRCSSRLLVAAAYLYSVKQFNAGAPVEFQKRVKSNLVEEEVDTLLESLNVDPFYRNDVANWFGDVYGRYHILVPPLLSRWSKMKRTNPAVTLAETFFTHSQWKIQLGRDSYWNSILKCASSY
jgi:hypothetical protein